MKMDLNQTKLVGLTMQLELKTKEYQMLCQELEDMKSQNIDPNDILFIELAEKFLNNQSELIKIVNELKQLQKTTE